MIIQYDYVCLVTRIQEINLGHCYFGSKGTFNKCGD